MKLTSFLQSFGTKHASEALRGKARSWTRESECGGSTVEEKTPTIYYLSHFKQVPLELLRRATKKGRVLHYDSTWRFFPQNRGQTIRERCSWALFSAAKENGSRNRVTLKNGKKEYQDASTSILSLRVSSFKPYTQILRVRDMGSLLSLIDLPENLLGSLLVECVLRFSVELVVVVVVVQLGFAHSPTDWLTHTERVHKQLKSRIISPLSRRMHNDRQWPPKVWKIAFSGLGGLYLVSFGGERARGTLAQQGIGNIYQHDDPVYYLSFHYHARFSSRELLVEKLEFVIDFGPSQAIV